MISSTIFMVMQEVIRQSITSRGHCHSIEPVSMMSLSTIITINSERPIRHQEIVFKKYRVKALTLSQAVQNNKDEQDEIRWQLKKQLETDN